MAKVKVLSTSGTREVRTLVELIKDLKGMKGKKKFTVLSEGRHSCNRDPFFKVGDILYISGKFNKDGLFIGKWKGTLL